MLKKTLLPALMAALLLAACAGRKPKDAVSDPSAAKAAAAAKPGSVGPGQEGAPIQVGPDFAAAVPVEEAWKTLTDVENWGLWNPKVTAVKPGAGLNTGSELQWQWEEREVKAVVVELKENEVLLLSGSRTGPGVGLRWTLRPMDKQHCVISLRAVLRSGASQTQIANASLETTAWVSALQAELEKKAAALAPPKKPKKTAKKG